MLIFKGERYFFKFEYSFFGGLSLTNLLSFLLFPFLFLQFFFPHPHLILFFLTLLPSSLHSSYFLIYLSLSFISSSFSSSSMSYFPLPFKPPDPPSLLFLYTTFLFLLRPLQGLPRAVKKSSQWDSTVSCLMAHAGDRRPYFPPVQEQGSTALTPRFFPHGNVYFSSFCLL